MGYSQQPMMAYLLAMEQNNWVLHSRISPSITYLICKKFMIGRKFSIDTFRGHVNQINLFIMDRLTNFQQTQKSLSLNKNQKRIEFGMHMCLLQWVNSLIFNTVAMNDEYKQQLSHSLLSGANNSHSRSNENSNSVSISVNNSSNPQVSIQLMDNLQQISVECTNYLLSMPSLHLIMSRIQNIELKNSQQSQGLHQNNSQRLKLSNYQNKLKHSLEYSLLSTVSYICPKMGIQFRNQQLMTIQQIQNKIGMLTQCQCQCVNCQLNQNIRVCINNQLFGHKAQHIETPKKKQIQNYSIQSLQNHLLKNFNTPLMSIASLIDANYYTHQIQRPIFKGVLISGAQFMHYAIQSFLQKSKYSKNQIFSQAMAQSDRVFQLFMAVIEYRFIGMYGKWIFLILNYITNIGQVQSPQHKLSLQQTVYKNIAKFFQLLPTDHTQFSHLLIQINNQLTQIPNQSNSRGHNLPQNISLDIIKKFIFNRFLLNPRLFYDYIDNQHNIDQNKLMSTFNAIRLMFYPKKCEKQSFIGQKQAQKLQAILLCVINEPSNIPKQSNTNKHLGEQSVRLKLQSNTKTKQKGVKNPNAQNQVNKCVVYQLDRCLHSDYQNIYSEWFQVYGSDRHIGSEKSNKLLNVGDKDHSYQLSFSFVTNRNTSNGNISIKRELKQKKVYIQKQIRVIPQSESRQENKNMNIVRQVGNYGNSLSNIASPTSQKSKKTVYTQITDINPLKFDKPTQQQVELGMIQDLVARRRALGQARRLIEERVDRKKNKRQVFNANFNAVCQRFHCIKCQIERDASLVNIAILAI